MLVREKQAVGFLTVLGALLAGLLSHAVAQSLMGQLPGTHHRTPIDEAGIFLQAYLPGDQVKIISLLVTDVNWC